MIPRKLATPRRPVCILGVARNPGALLVPAVALCAAEQQRSGWTLQAPCTLDAPTRDERAAPAATRCHLRGPPLPSAARSCCQALGPGSRLCASRCRCPAATADAAAAAAVAKVAAAAFTAVAAVHVAIAAAPPLVPPVGCATAAASTKAHKRQVLFQTKLSRGVGELC